MLNLTENIDVEDIDAWFGKASSLWEANSKSVSEVSYKLSKMPNVGSLDPGLRRLAFVALSLHQNPGLTILAVGFFFGLLYAQSKIEIDELTKLAVLPSSDKESPNSQLNS